MSEIMLYSPYKHERWTSFVLFAMGVYSIIINIVYPKVFFSILSIAIFATLLLISMTHSVIIAFGQDEIKVSDYKSDKKYLWVDFNNAYYGVNFKGFRYLTLSSKSLDEKEIRKLCNKCSVSMRGVLYDNDTLTFYVHRKSEKEIDDLLQLRFPNKLSID